MKTCKDLYPDIVAAARREPNGAELAQHLEGCRNCRQTLANQRTLTAALAAMRESDPLPPPALQTVLLGNLPRRNAKLPGRARKQAVVAVAAAAVLALAFFWPKPQSPAPPQTARVAPPPPALVVEQPQPVRQTPARVKRYKAPRPAPAAPEPQPEVATDFYPVPYTEPLRPNQRADIYRVQVPRASMAAFGIPVIGGRLDSQITADVIVGEDGVTRAVRFIRQ